MESLDRYLSINDACEAFSFSRSTFYRMLDDRDSGLREIVVRIPPKTGRIRVPQAAFEAWLRQKRRRSRSPLARPDATEIASLDPGKKA